MGAGLGIDLVLVATGRTRELIMTRIKILLCNYDCKIIVTSTVCTQIFVTALVTFSVCVFIMVHVCVCLCVHTHTGKHC